ncbi:DNA starvation/stationary phase protection protein [bacterium]|nr:DNA starvation/stationary phase protection protein [bacterium]
MTNEFLKLSNDDKSALSEGSTIHGEKAQTVTILNELADAQFMLLGKTLCYHWNVSGPRFHSLHVFLDGQYNALLKMLDTMAERVKIIGGAAFAPMRQLESFSNGRKHDLEKLSTNEMISDLVREHHTVIATTENFLKKNDSKIDPGTEDLLVANLREHQKMTWMLKSHLS